MLGVGRQTLHPVGNQLAQTADIFVFCCQHADGFCLFILGRRILFGIDCGFGQTRAVFQSGRRRFFRVDRFIDTRANRLGIKIGIGNGGKKIQRYAVIVLFIHLRSFCAQFHKYFRIPFGDIDQQILQIGYLGILAAHTHPCAAGIAGRLLTLITKHIAHIAPPFTFCFSISFSHTKNRNECYGPKGRQNRTCRASRSLDRKTG
jgi:hypothetical protein